LYRTNFNSHGGATNAAPPPRLARGGRIQRLIEVAERLGAVRALRPLHDWRHASLTVLAYHRVMPTDALDTYPFDTELISATPAQFEWQMAYVRRHLNPVSLTDAVAHLEGKASLPPKAIAVTFDDGFSDTYRYAFPVLKRYSIPATVFVATGYVDSGDPFWFELVAYLMFTVESGALRVGDGEAAFPSGPSVRERTQSLREAQEMLKGLPNPRRTDVISEWTRRFARQIEHGARAHSGPITWTQVHEMATAGIEFGSHSITHPNLTQLTDSGLDWELAESRRTLEDHLQRSVTTLAYPIGTRSAFDARVIAAAERAGFKLGVTYVSGSNPLATLDRFALRRHGIGLCTSPQYFRALTQLPSWIS
jgi:peptidoglycan/xylan/chitin deacetylase (PgdA/CDA1 family)